MFKKSCLFFLVSTICVCLSTVTANAYVIYSDVPSSGDLYDTYNGAFTVIGGSLSINKSSAESAAQFTAAEGGAGSFNVTQIDVAVDKQATFDSVGNFQVKIWTSSFYATTDLPDAPGYDVPGVALYTSPNLIATGNFASQHGLVSISGITELSLTAGEEYFISVTTNPGGALAWYGNNQSVSGLVVTTYDRELSWNKSPSTAPIMLPAFEILGSPQSSVPIPAAIWLLGSGLIGLAGVRRKFKK